MYIEAIPNPLQRVAFTIDEFRHRNGGICRGTVYNEIARGNLKTIKVGRRRLITAEQETDWLLKCEEVAQ